MPNLILDAQQAAQNLTSTPPPAPLSDAGSPKPPMQVQTPPPATQGAPQGQPAALPPTIAPSAIPQAEINTEPTVDPVAAGYGDEPVMAQVNRTMSLGGNLIPGVIKSVYHQDPRWLQTALAGNQVSFDTDIQRLGESQNWQPWVIGTSKFAATVATNPFTYAGMFGSVGEMALDLHPANLAMKGIKTVATPVVSGLSYGLTHDLQTGASNRLGDAISYVVGQYTDDAVRAGSNALRRDVVTASNPIHQAAIEVNQEAVKLGQSIADDLVGKWNIPPGEARKLTDELWQTRLGNEQLIQAHYNPSATGATAAAIRAQYAAEDAAIRAHATRLGLPEAQLEAYAGRVSSVISNYEINLKAITDAAAKGNLPPNLLSQGALYNAAVTQKEFKIVGDFNSAVASLTGSTHPDIAQEAIALNQRIIQRQLNISRGIPRPQLDASIAQDAVELISKLPPSTIDHLITRGDIAKLPLHSDELTHIIVSKSIQLGPNVSVPQKVLEVARQQADTFILNPQVAIQRSFKALTSEIQTGVLADSLRTNGIKEGWASSTYKPGYVPLSDNAIKIMGDKARGIYVDPEASRMMDNFLHIYTSPKAAGIFGSRLDEVVGAWKAGVLSNPKTILNNITGNLAQYDMGRGNPLELKPAVQALQKIYSDPAGAYKDPFLKELMDNQITSVNQVKITPPKFGGKAELIQKARDIVEPNIHKGLVPTAIVDNAQRLNNAADDMFRVGLYRTYRASGMAAEDAARKVKLFYYNGSPLGEMTAFEQNYIQRAVPFYRWMKNNIPGQIRNIVNNPFSSLRQLSLANGLGLFGNSDAQPVNNLEGVSMVSGSGDTAGEAVSYRTTNTVPANDLLRLVRGADMAIKGDIPGGIQQAAGVGPAEGGLNPFIGASVEFWKGMESKPQLGDLEQQTKDNLNAALDKPVKGTKTVLGFNASPAVAAVRDQIPGIKDLEFILGGAGILGHGPVKRGVFMPDLPGTPNLLTGQIPDAEERRTSREKLINWLGVPTAQLSTIRDFQNIGYDAQEKWIKAYEKKATAVARQGDTQLAQFLADYTAKLTAVHEAHGRVLDTTQQAIDQGTVYKRPSGATRKPGTMVRAEQANTRANKSLDKFVTQQKQETP